VIPFRLSLHPGVSVCEQVVYAAKKAIISGQLRPGESFPSVRVLSRGLKINPNTAHKAVAELTAQGLLEVLPGIGTVVAASPSASTAPERARLLGGEVERLVVEAKKMGLALDDLLTAVGKHWEALRDRESPKEPAPV
jgi:GntR family transcriptional regulator